VWIGQTPTKVPLGGSSETGNGLYEMGKNPAWSGADKESQEATGTELIKALRTLDGE